MPKKAPPMDEDARELMDAYERGECVPSPDEEALIGQLKQAAHQYMRKDARINIRISSTDLSGLKRRAAKEGLPYQTLIASVLHKYVNGTLKSESL